jgi:hypothetical protein
MAETARYSIVHDALTEGLANLRKWHSKTNDSIAYFICLGAVYKYCLNVAN